MEQELNPYAPPQAGGLAVSSEALRHRLGGLPAESTVKGLGMVSICGALLGGLAVCSLVARMEKEYGVFSMEMRVRGLGVPLAWLVCGLGLWRIKRWAWSASIVFHVCLGLWNVMHLPLGVLGLALDVVVLRVLLLPKTRRVMSGDYVDIMRTTPAVHAPVPAWARWVGGLLILAGLLSFLSTL